MSEDRLDERRALARETMEVLDAWKLAADEVCLVLGLPDKVRQRSINKFRSYDPFPADAGVERRAGYVVRIGQALRTTYPTNPAMGSRWLRQRHRRLGCSPLAQILGQGEAGLEQVLAELDCAFGWELSDRAVEAVVVAG